MKPSSKMGFAGETDTYLCRIELEVLSSVEHCTNVIWGNSDGTWGFSSLSETGVPWHL